MAANDFFSHDGFNGNTLATRAQDVSFLTYPLGENIAAGYNSVRSVVLAWMWYALPSTLFPPVFSLLPFPFADFNAAL